MSDSDYERLVDLNMVALDELRTLVTQESALAPAWKEAITQLLEGSNVPVDLDCIEQLIREEPSAKT